MTRYRTIAASVLLASTLGFAAAPVFAERDCGAKEGFMEHRGAHMAKDHKKLHAALKLTPDQEGAWKKMMDAQQPMAMAMGERGRADDMAKLTTPERADKMLEAMKEHQAHQVEHVAALKEFYAVLTPEQKKVFDDFHSAEHRGMHGKMKRQASATERAPRQNP